MRSRVLPAPDRTKRLELTGLTPGELGEIMASPRPEGLAPSPTRGRAVWRHLRDGGGWELPRSLPECGAAAMSALKARVRGPELSVEERLTSRDGTMKWRMAARGLAVETVLIPTDTRATVCVSTQSGCSRYCDFCATARMGFRGQLTAGEIVGQVLIARAASAQPVTNVVMMGMGEPLDNYEEVVQAIRVLDEGLQLSPRHVTVSTSGVLPQMQRLWAETRACVALSLHATTQEARDAMMPRVARWPLESLIGWMREASAGEGPRGRHFFIEYVLLADHNDTDADAERVRAFQTRLVDAGILTITRETRGDDAAAACGQLAVGATEVVRREARPE